jgi:hypothetical protein
MDKGIDFFKQALARAPDYAMAYAGLADPIRRRALLNPLNRLETSGYY